MGRILRAGIPALVLPCLVFLAPSSTDAANANFGNLAGLTPNQRAMAIGIQHVCESLAPSAATLTGDRQDLFFRCREMVQTSNALQGSGPTGFSLGLSSADTAEALTKLSHQNTTTQGTSAVEAAPRVIAARLASLRGGAVPRFAFNGQRLDGVLAFAPQTERGAGPGAEPSASNRFGVFVNGTGSVGEKDRTERAEGFDFFTAGAIAGADYRVSENFIAGAAFRYLHTSSDLVRLLGDTQVDGYGGSLYATYYAGPFFVDLHGGFTWNVYTSRRNMVYASTSRVAKADTDGQQYDVDLGAGYEFALNGFRLTPYGRLEYVNAAIESATEKDAGGLNLVVGGQRVQSLQTAVGLQLAYSWSVPFGVLVPQLRAEWRHEFKDGSRSLTARYLNDPTVTPILITTDNPDRNFAALGAGMSGVFARGLTAFLYYETVLALRDVTNHQFVGGVRLEF